MVLAPEGTGGGLVRRGAEEKEGSPQLVSISSGGKPLYRVHARQASVIRTCGGAIEGNKGKSGPTSSPSPAAVNTDIYHGPCNFGAVGELSLSLFSSPPPPTTFPSTLILGELSSVRDNVSPPENPRSTQFPPKLPQGSWLNTRPWGIARIPRRFQNDWSTQRIWTRPPFSQWVGDAAGPTTVAIVDVVAYRFVLGTLCPERYL
ncbi:uncharacterized protein N7477_001386 [Penicillium maclennaniae]|uniref:uncharacterized protein n=1 Tax=Penicillium maclennaniae TaxID=1343394 RepID=UPI002540EB67|nr:uncharacterized protein N7477_001386 [Penicillium maclennaniae]KAJ5681446.1 hypothetical protein N7477_001386 [Penicillium maclennaniae]